MDGPLLIFAIVLLAAVLGVALMLCLQVLALRQGLDRELGQSREQTRASLQENSATVDRRVAELKSELNQRLAELTGQLAKELGENRSQVGASSKLLFDRLKAGSDLFAKISEQFGQLQQSSSALAEMGADIRNLQQILSPSTGRGQFGEQLLEQLLANTLPAGGFQMQYSFRGGEKVDAIVRLAQGLIAIDSKFPLPAFSRWVQAAGPEARKLAYRDFARDCRKHVEDIAGKYIRPDEGTLEFALMYIPAENVYYETILRHEDLGGGQSIADYAAARRVIPVSPNTLLLYLQVILIGLRGLQVQENARQILAELSRLNDELGKFSDEYRLLGRHLENARSKHNEGQNRLERFTGQVQQLAQRKEEKPGEPSSVVVR